MVFFGAIRTDDPRHGEPMVVTSTGGRVKVTPFAAYPAKGRATGGVRAHRFLKGETRLVLAWVGPRPVGATAPATRWSCRRRTRAGTAPAWPLWCRTWSGTWWSGTENAFAGSGTVPGSGEGCGAGEKRGAPYRDGSGSSHSIFGLAPA